MARLVIACPLVFHSPDGTRIAVVTDSIAVREVTPELHDHLQKGTNAVIYLGVRSSGFGVKETFEDVLKMFSECEATVQGDDDEKAKSGHSEEKK